MSECCSKENEGLYFSIFWIFNMGSLIVGNLMAALVVSKINLSVFYYIMTFINFLCVCWFFVLPKPKPIPTDEKSIEEIKVEESEPLDEVKQRKSRAFSEDEREERGIPKAGGSEDGACVPLNLS